jgi:hypothetical protein
MKVFKERRLQGVGVRLERVYDSATICAKTFIPYITANVSAPNVLAANVIVTGIFHRHLVSLNRYQSRTLRLSSACPFPHFLTPYVSIYQNQTVA